MNIKISTFIGVALSLLLLHACAALNTDYELPQQHPPDAEVGNRRPICTKCHDPIGEQIVFKQFDHTAYFAENHRQVAYQQSQVCFLCHQESSCNDCHGVRVELKPSLKNQTDNFRRTPHRGDYISRHRIDGRTDPSSCYRCHGNPKTSESCVRCHA
ncbi:MAG: cytochrome C [Proteobacteria bacterium]|nr:cytochrome C [Pseudomonadota bacterium]